MREKHVTRATDSIIKSGQKDTEASIPNKADKKFNSANVSILTSVGLWRKASCFHKKFQVFCLSTM